MEMKYISTLLYENDCVIIPGLGGFVSNYEPARIEGDRNRFIPPSKKILFNTRLTSNDGLLANHIAVSEGISYSKAMDLVHRFVDRCNKELENKKKVRFPGIGMLYKDANDKILFEQDTQVNYLPEAYGLSQFISPAIYRESSYRRFENKMKSSPVASARRHKIVRGLKWAAVLIPIAAIATWSYLNFDKLEQKYEQYAIYFQPLHEQVDNGEAGIEDHYEAAKDFAEKNGDLSVNTSSILPTNNNSKTLEAKTEAKNDKESIASADQPETKKDRTPNSPQPDKTTSSEPDKIQKQSNKTNYQYHIITGSFLDRSNATDHLRELKTYGFSARIAGESSNGYYRVSAIATKSKNEAVNKLRMIREEDFSNAWLLKK